MASGGVAPRHLRVKVLLSEADRRRLDKFAKFAADSKQFMALQKAMEPATRLARSPAGKQLSEIAERAAQAKRIIDRATLAQQERLARMKVREVVALNAAGKLPRARERAPRRRTSVTVARRPVRRRAQARAGPDDGSGSGEPPSDDLERLRGFTVASRRMFCHVGRRLGARAATA
jgi:hypothetical protein